MGSARPRLAGSRSPRQVGKSEPHTLASDMRTTAAPGSGSGTGYSRISKGWPNPRKMAARPVLAMCQQGKPGENAYAGGRLMQTDQFGRGELGVEALGHTAIAVR